MNREPVLTRLLDKSFLGIIFTCLAFIFKPVGWLLDKLTKWEKQRSLSQKIRHARIWILLYVYLAVHRWVPPEYAKWAPYIVPDEPSSLYVRIGVSIIWILLLAGLIDKYRKLTIIKLTKEPYAGLIVQIKNEYFKVVSYKPGTTAWKAKVKKATKKESLITEIMSS